VCFSCVLNRTDRLIHSLGPRVLTLISSSNTMASTPSSSTPDDGIGASKANQDILLDFLELATEGVELDKLYPSLQFDPSKPDLNKPRSYLVRCDLDFRRSPSTFPTEISKVAYASNGLQGTALVWFLNLLRPGQLSNPRSPTGSWDLFRERFLKDFYDTKSRAQAAIELRTYKLRSTAPRDVASFNVHFNELVYQCNYPDEDVQALYWDSIPSELRIYLLQIQLTSDLTQLQRATEELAIALPSRAPLRQVLSSPWPAPGASKTTTPPNARTDATSIVPTIRPPLTQEEKDRRAREDLCRYCGVLCVGWGKTIIR